MRCTFFDVLLAATKEVGTQIKLQALCIVCPCEMMQKDDTK